MDAGNSQIQGSGQVTSATRARGRRAGVALVKLVALAQVVMFFGQHADSKGKDARPVAVKTILKRTMASGRPEVSEVARELGMSERTLQRRITEEGRTFHGLLFSARQELARHLLADDDTVGVDEVV
jgi:AraC-like DNA-binding protein